MKHLIIVLIDVKNLNMLQSNILFGFYISFLRLAIKFRISLIVFRFIVNGSIIVFQFGACCVIYVFLGSHLKEVIDEYTNYHIPKSTYFLYMLIPLIIINFIRPLKVIVLFSAIGNAFMITVLVVVFQVCVFSYSKNKVLKF